LMSLVLTLPSVAEPDKPLTIFAAASLTDVLSAHAQKWAKAQSTATPLPRLSFAASAVMARQIKAGAPADIFISANPQWVNFLQTANLTEGKAHVVAKNQLVLAAPISQQLQPMAEVSGSSLIALLGNKPFAMANPATAPAGQYARRYLKHLSVWNRVKGQAAFTSNVRQALVLIERGSLFGFIYKSDASRSKLVQTLFTVPSLASGEILYQATALQSAPLSAQTFLAYLTSKNAQSLWEEAGFLTVPQNETLYPVPK
ncbi:MAG: molybdate ABC transporter substrate-binding protein, partial [Kordiimonadaceae bacterium]|nr:molybdate ABC transporter substrate-binding protein [Kordiimonadaceae bacterium]